MSGLREAGVGKRSRYGDGCVEHADAATMCERKEEHEDTTVCNSLLR